MRAVGAAASVIFVLCLPLLLFSSNMRLVVNSSGLYLREFDRYNVSQSTGLPREELAKAARGLIAYFNSGETYVHLRVRGQQGEFELFKERETEHLKDVKTLIQLDYKVQWATLGYALSYLLFVLAWKRRQAGHYLGRAALAGSSLTVAVLLVLGLAALVSFNQLFLLFHLVSFTNLLWVLDPRTDYLIRMFPQGFFYDATLILAASTLAEALVIGGICWWGPRRRKKPSRLRAKARV
ncbi:MAG: TIGR01906 family membrane protein [Chloroflexi bacterium]|nr:TIGR01906 family membrane protein [Chloroflexota bacterium]